MSEGKIGARGKGVGSRMIMCGAFQAGYLGYSEGFSGMWSK